MSTEPNGGQDEAAARQRDQKMAEARNQFLDSFAALAENLSALEETTNGVGYVLHEELRPLGNSLHSDLNSIIHELRRLNTNFERLLNLESSQSPLIQILRGVVSR